MTKDLILARFRGVKERCTDCYQARCPVHEDKHPSLSIRFTDDGKALLHCFAGCDTAEILGRVGLRYSDLFNV